MSIDLAAALGWSSASTVLVEPTIVEPRSAPEPVARAPSTTLDDIVIARCRTSLFRYVVEQWKRCPTLASTALELGFDPPTDELGRQARLPDRGHIKTICDHLQGQLEDAAARRDDPSKVLRAQNLLINCPPRSLKTILLALASAWAWIRWPYLQILYVSATPSMILVSARVFRDAVSSDWYQQSFVGENWKIRDDQDALSSMGNTVGGARVGKGFEAKVLGSNADWLCCARGTKVATEIGEIPIEQLGSMEPKPRVWSQNPKGELELKQIISWTHSGRKKVGSVRVSANNVLRCTHDHQIWTTDGYHDASQTLGRTVSILRRSDSLRRNGYSAPVPNVFISNAAVRHVSENISAPSVRIRQTRPPRVSARLVLKQVCTRQEASVHTQLQTVSENLSAGHLQNKSSVLFQELLPHFRRRPAASTGSDLRTLFQNILTQKQRPSFLFSRLCREDSLDQNDGIRQFEFYREGAAKFQGRSQRFLRRGSMAQTGPVNTYSRSRTLCNLSTNGDDQRTRFASASCGRGPLQQCAREFDHVMRCVPSKASWSYATVTAVNFGTEQTGNEESDVYDIGVETNHNFFANGILVHNCVDDAHDMNDSPESIQAACEHYDQNLSSRINDPRTGIRTAIMQRCARGDFSEHVLAQGWFHLRMPLEFEKHPECRCPQCLLCETRTPNAFGWVDWRTEEGEVLHPRYTAEFRAERMLVLRPHGYAGQMQQRPAPKGGNQFKVAFWRFAAIAGESPGGTGGTPAEIQARRPHGAREGPAQLTIKRREDGRLDVEWVCLSVDVTGGSTNTDASALGLVGACGIAERRIILADYTPGPRSWGQTMGDIKGALVALANLTGWHTKIRVLVEKKALGEAAIVQLTEAIADGELKDRLGRVIHAIVEAYEPTGKGSKEQRAEVLEPMLESGLLFLLDGALWLTRPHEAAAITTFVDEFSAFPKGARDDRVDCCSQLVDRYRKKTSDWTKLFA